MYIYIYAYIYIYIYVAIYTNLLSQFTGANILCHHLHGGRAYRHLPRLFHGWIRFTCRFSSASVSCTFCESTRLFTSGGDSTRSTLVLAAPGPAGLLWRTTGADMVTGADMITEAPEGSAEGQCSAGWCKPCRVQLSSSCWWSFSSSSENRTDEPTLKTACLQPKAIPVRFYQLAPAAAWKTMSSD